MNMKAKILVRALLATAMLISGGLFMSVNASVNQTLMGTPTTRAVAGVTAADTSGASPAATSDVLIGHAGMLNELVRLDLTPALAPRGIAIKREGGNTLTIARSI